MARPAKASPFGRGVTEGDGEGKDAAKQLLHSDSIALTKNLLIAAQKLFCPGLALSGATRQLSRRESLWHVGQVYAGRAKHDVSGTVVRCCQDSRQLDKVRCPEAAGPVSEARAFAPYRASGVQLRVARLASGSPFGATATTAASGGNREELLGPRPAGCERQRSRRWEPQPGQCHCFAMTERASSLFCLLYLQKSGHQSRIITYVS